MADPELRHPYGQKNFMGIHTSGASATQWVKDRKWDTNGDGTGDPHPDMFYFNSLVEDFYRWDTVEGDWSAIGRGIVAWEGYTEAITRVNTTQFTVTDNAEAQRVFTTGRPLIAYLSEEAQPRYLLVTGYVAGTVDVAGGLPVAITGQVNYGDFTRVVQVDFNVPGTLPNSGTTSLLSDVNKAAFRWQLGPAHLVRCLGYLDSADTGSAITICPLIEGSAALTSDLSIPTDQTWATTSDEIDVGNSEVRTDEDVELEFNPGTGADAADLSVSLAFILE